MSQKRFGGARFGFAVCAFLAACANGPPVSQIGVATMTVDRTIVLDLANDADGRPAHARLEYRPGSPGYASVLAHIGDLSPGKTRPVLAWPDEPDEP